MPFNEIKNNNDFSFIPFEEGCVLFNEIEQSVLILNQTAAFIWCAAFEVDSVDELIALLSREFSISVDVAHQDIQRFFSGFQSCRLFLPKEEQYGSFLRPVNNALDSQFIKHNDVLTLLVAQQLFKISLPCIDLKRELSRIYRQFVCSSDKLCHSDICRFIDVHSSNTNNQMLFSIFVDNQCVIEALQQDGVIPFLFGIVFETIWKAEQENSPLMFHAAVLSPTEGTAVIFPAQSGSGKSTLAALLAAKGWQFYTDELAVVLPAAGYVLPCPLPVCVKEQAVTVLSDYYSELKAFKRHHRLDDKVVYYLPIEHSAMFSGNAATIQAIVFPQYNQNSVCELTTLGKRAALEHFLECGSAGRAMGFEELSAVVQMVDHLSCYKLIYSDSEMMVAELERICCN